MMSTQALDPIVAQCIARQMPVGSPMLGRRATRVRRREVTGMLIGRMTPTCHLLALEEAKNSWASQAVLNLQAMRVGGV